MRAPRGKGTINKHGYRMIGIAGKLYAEHRLAWEGQRGTIPAGWLIHHKDGNKLNNAIENLECMSRTMHNRLHRHAAKNKGAN